MQISHLDPIETIHPDMLVPVSIAGKTVKISVSQLTASLPEKVVAFCGVRGATANVTYAEGESPSARAVIYDTVTDAFYAMAERVIGPAESAIISRVYYNDWPDRHLYYEDDGLTVRSGVIFLSDEGGMYMKSGSGLRLVGADRKDIALLTPVRCADEDDLAAKAAMDEYPVGQQFYIPEGD